jgi:flagellar biosynthesis/type III secretory pathway chaperone
MVDLISILAENEKVLAELALVLTDEQRCIVDLDLASLAENGGRKEKITTRLSRVRDESRAMIRQAGGELGLNGAPSLTALIDAAGTDEQERLRPLQRRIQRLATALERQHEVNRRMLQNSLNMINGSMALFARLLGGCDTYGAQGRISSGSTGWSMLRQEM